MTDSALEESLRQWGAAKRKLLGVPAQPRSIFGRISDEGSVGAAIRGQPPDDPEVMLSTALETARAIRTALNDHALRYQWHVCLVAQYVHWGKASTKAKRMSLALPEYYSSLNSARAVVSEYLTRIADSPQE